MKDCFPVDTEVIDLLAQSQASSLSHIQFSVGYIVRL